MPLEHTSPNLNRTRHQSHRTTLIWGLIVASLLSSHSGENRSSLRVNVTQKGTLGVSERRNFDFYLGEQQFALVSIEQVDSDISVSIDQNGKTLDIDEFEYGTEIVPILSQEPATIRLKIHALGPQAPFTIRWEYTRPKRESDDRWLKAALDSTYSKAALRRGNSSDIVEAIRSDEMTVQLWHELGEARGESRTFIKLGDARYRINDLEEARKAYADAVDICSSRNDLFCISEGLNNIGLCDWGLGNLDDAISALTRALDGWTKLNFPYGRAASLNNLGLLYWQYSGEWQKAINQYEDAAAIFHDKDPRSEAFSLNNIGLVYTALAEYTQAVQYLDSARRLLLDGDNHLELGRTLINLGRAQFLSGDSATALLAIEQALEEIRKQPNELTRADALNNRGQIMIGLNRLEDAQKELTEAVEIYHGLGDRIGTASALHHLGVALLRREKLDSAQVYLNRALESRRALRLKEDQTETLFMLAQLDQKRRRLEGAVARLRQAMEITESLRIAVAGSTFRSSYFSKKQDYYGLSVELLMQLHALNPARGFDRQAFEVAERARARSLLDSLAESPASIRNGSGVDHNLLLRQDFLQKRLRYQSQKLLSSEPDEAHLAVLDSTIDELHRIEAEIRHKSPRYAALVAPKAGSLVEIQKHIETNTLVLEYMLGHAQSVVWAVSRDSFRAFELPSRSELEHDAKRLVDLFARGPGYRGPDEQKEVNQLLSSLGRKLLGPVDGLKNAKTVAIVAEGVVQYVPFAALLLESQGNAESFGLSHEFVLLPSASTLLVLDPHANDNPHDLIAMVGDPVFDTQDSRVKIDVSSANSAVPSLPRLAFGKVEASCIARSCPVGQCRFMLGFDARKNALENGELSSFQILQLSTHALVDDRRPELSRIIFSRVDEHGRLVDGSLLLSDLYKLPKLRASLAMLSACQTALGKDVRGEGVINLARGFMYAGVRNVGVTLWPVDDESSAQFMCAFYHALFEDQGSVPGALLVARRTIAAEKRWADPTHWAALELVGPGN